MATRQDKNLISKKPPINSQTKLMSFDIETNGLHGKAFAIGAVVMDSDGNVLNEFSARCRLTSKVDDWVKSNVLPAIVDMPITHDDYESLREAFWQWYLQAKEQSDYILVNNGYPVEYRFLLDCQEANIEERYWDHPFPILELSSMLLMTDHDSNSSKRLLKKKIDDDFGRKMHHPVEDAKMAVLLAFEALKLAGKL